MDFIFNDGAWEEMDKIPTRNRGFLYGDGCFETLLITHGKCTGWRFREQRLSAAFAYLGLELDLSYTLLRKSIELLLAERGVNYARARITFYRSGLGKYMPESNSVEMVLQLDPLERLSFNHHPAKLFAIGETVLSANTAGNHKLIGKHWQVVASAEAKRRNVDDLILLNDHGAVSEMIASNLFFSIAGEVYTPRLATGCLAGVARAALLEMDNVREVNATLDELLEADFMFCANSIRGIEVLSADKVDQVYEMVKPFARHLEMALEVN